MEDQEGGRDDNHSLFANIADLIKATKDLFRAEVNFQKSRLGYTQLQVVRIAAALAFSALMIFLALFAIVVSAVVALAPEMTVLGAAGGVALCCLIAAAAGLLTVWIVLKRLRDLR